MSNSLSIVIPALNEEEFINKTVSEILPVARKIFSAFEIILVDDGSKDKTPEIMNKLAEQNPEIFVIHHPTPRGVGLAFWEGIDVAKFEYLTLIPGDNAFNIDGLRTMFESVGKADLVVTYRQNATHARTLFRIFLSKAFRLFVIILSGYHLRDFYSAEIYPVKLARQTKYRSNGYTYQIDTIIDLLRRGVSYIEVPASLNLRESSNSQVLKWKTVREVCLLYWRLVFHKN